MHQASLRLFALFGSVAALSAVATPLNAAPSAEEKSITISEGTDSQIAISPDHKTIIVNLQGLLYAMPITGGAAKQITTPYQEASHPDWSSRGDLVAIQSYAGGTFHIWTMHPDGTALKQITTGHGGSDLQFIWPALPERKPDATAGIAAELYIRRSGVFTELPSDENVQLQGSL